MINFKLNIANINHRKIENSINVEICNDANIISECIKLFNDEIIWDNMFDIESAKTRIFLKEQFYVGKYNSKIFGYFWIKVLLENHYLIYNVFSKNKSFGKQYGATDMLYCVLSKFNNGYFYAEVDEWNTKSQRVFEKLGFVKCEEISYIPNQWE